MVKPPFIAHSDAAARAKEQREIRDWHTLVAKLASEAETLHSWTQRPPEDELGEKINGTITKLASGLEGDALRLAQALPGDGDSNEPAPPSAVPQPETLVRPAGLGDTVDKIV
jgi:hypothetical protein